MTDTDKPNLPALQEAIEWAEHNALAPDEAEPGQLFWDQETWYTGPEEDYSCGTGMCIAGYISHLNGAKPKLSEENPDNKTAYYCITPEGEHMLIQEHARRVLNIDSTASTILFGANNDLHALKSMYNCLAQDGDLTEWEWGNV